MTSRHRLLLPIKRSSQTPRMCKPLRDTSNRGSSPGRTLQASSPLVLKSAARWRDLLELDPSPGVSDGGAMNAKQKLLIELRSMISEQLGVREEAISNESGWTLLGADSLDRMQMSLAIERAFEVDIPHPVGEHLNTVGETIDHLLALIRERTPISVIQIEPAITSQQWAEMTAIRTQVFTKEYGFSFQS